MRALIGLATLALVGLGAGVDGSRDVRATAEARLAPAVGVLQSALGDGLDADMARAFLDAATGANTVMCSLALRGVANSWGAYGSMTTVVGFGVPGPAESELLQWAMERRLEPDALGPLADALAHPDECRRLAAAALFGRLDQAVALPVLEPLARSGAETSRIAALRALGHLEARGSLQALTGALQDDNAAVRQVAAWSLGRIEDPGAVEALSTALEDPDPGVRGNAAWAFGQIEHRDAIAPLSEALDGDREAAVRINAAWALGQIEHADAVPALTRALASDADPLVRKAAAWALGQLS